MFLEIVALLILAIAVVSPFVLARYFSTNLQKSRDLDRVRQDRVAARIELLAKETIEAGRTISISQSDLTKELESFWKHVDEENAFLKSEYQNFNKLAKSDMMFARREELLRSKELKIALERLMGIALTSRQPASPNDILALENLNNRISELEMILEVDDTM